MTSTGDSCALTNPDDGVFKVPYLPLFPPGNGNNSIKLFPSFQDPGTVLKFLNTMIAAQNLSQPVVPVKPPPIPVDVEFLVMLESLTPRNLAKRPGKLRTEAEYKQWNALRQRQNRRKMTETLKNGLVLQQRLRAEVIENVVQLRKMLFHDQGQVDVRLRVSNFLGLSLQVVEVIPEFQSILKRYSDQRVVISEMEGDPKSTFYKGKTLELQGKYKEYQKTRVQSRIPSELKKKMEDAVIRENCYDLFMDNKRIKMVTRELLRNEEDLKRDVEVWLQGIVQQIKDLLKQQIPALSGQEQVEVQNPPT